MSARLFLLSPASCSGNRARLLLAPASRLALAQQLRTPGGAPLGEAFSFISQLYFRGKLAYARAFARPPSGGSSRAAHCFPKRPSGPPCPGDAEGHRVTPGSAWPVAGNGVLVITTSRGLLPCEAPATDEVLREFASVDLKANNDAYRRPLERCAREIAAHLGDEDEVVLLGSIATDKYVQVLTDVLADRLLFPKEFVGRGDMSRGGLLLRCVREGRELDYVPVVGSARHGVRPPKLPKIIVPRTRAASLPAAAPTTAHPGTSSPAGARAGLKRGARA